MVCACAFNISFLGAFVLGVRDSCIILASDVRSHNNLKSPGSLKKRGKYCGSDVLLRDAFVYYREPYTIVAALTTAACNMRVYYQVAVKKRSAYTCVYSSVSNAKVHSMYFLMFHYLSLTTVTVF